MSLYMKTIIIIIIVIIIVVIYYKWINKDEFTSVDKININNSEYSKIVWVYWENIKRDTFPTYISLCIDNLYKKTKDTDYKVIYLNENNIREYLPNLRKDFDNLLIAQKTDYYRIALLEKYGGVWIDADVIVMNNLKPIFDKLEEGYDYVGFGCTGYECVNGYGKPSNWVIGSLKNGKLIKRCLNKLDEKLDKKLNIMNDNPYDDSYHDYGKYIIWSSLEELMKESNYKYYHFTSEHDGARDMNGRWIHSPNFFNKEETKFLDENKLLFVVLYNSEIANNKEYEWMMNGTKERILNGDEWVCSIFRRAYKM